MKPAPGFTLEAPLDPTDNQAAAKAYSPVVYFPS